MVSATSWEMAQPCLGSPARLASTSSGGSAHRSNLSVTFALPGRSLRDYVGLLYSVTRYTATRYSVRHYSVSHPGQPTGLNREGWSRSRRARACHQRGGGRGQPEAPDRGSRCRDWVSLAHDRNSTREAFRERYRAAAGLMLIG